MTRFSVIVPMRAADAFIEDCLWSVRRQTDADFEVIVVDDDSPDASGAIAERHSREDGRISVLHLESSHGVGLARNAGIARATGEYLLFLDADDMFADDGVLAGLDVDLSVAVSTRAGVGYRRCNMASISRQVTPRHFEVFDQFERILAFLGAHPEHDSPEVRDALATSARTFLRSRSDRLRVIPPDLVDEFRRRSAAMTARMSHSSREERN